MALVVLRSCIGTDEATQCRVPLGANRANLCWVRTNAAPLRVKVMASADGASGMTDVARNVYGSMRHSPTSVAAQIAPSYSARSLTWHSREQASIWMKPSGVRTATPASSVPIHRFASASSSNIVMRLLGGPVVGTGDVLFGRALLDATNWVKRSPSNRANPPNVPTHRYPSLVTRAVLTLSSGRPWAVVIGRSTGAWEIDAVRATSGASNRTDSASRAASWRHGKGQDMGAVCRESGPMFTQAGMPLRLTRGVPVARDNADFHRLRVGGLIDPPCAARAGAAPW